MTKNDVYAIIGKINEISNDKKRKAKELAEVILSDFLPKCDNAERIYITDLLGNEYNYWLNNPYIDKTQDEQTISKQYFRLYDAIELILHAEYQVEYDETVKRMQQRYAEMKRNK